MEISTQQPMLQKLDTILCDITSPFRKFLFTDELCLVCASLCKATNSFNRTEFWESKLACENLVELKVDANVEAVRDHELAIFVKNWNTSVDQSSP